MHNHANQAREREREKVLNVPLNSHEIQSQSCHVQLKMNTGIFTSSSAGGFREASVLTSWTLSDFRLLACQITCHIVQIGKGAGGKLPGGRFSFASLSRSSASICSCKQNSWLFMAWPPYTLDCLEYQQMIFRSICSMNLIMSHCQKNKATGNSVS